jgi:hypothetical protein
MHLVIDQSINHSFHHALRVMLQLKLRVLRKKKKKKEAIASLRIK